MLVGLERIAFIFGIFMLVLSPAAVALTASADLDGDSEIGPSDLLALVTLLNAEKLGADLTLDGDVGSADLLEFYRQWKNRTFPSGDNLVITFRNSSSPKGVALLTDGLEVSKGMDEVTGADILNAFVTFDRFTVQGPGGPAADVFNASDAKGADTDWADLVVSEGLKGVHGPEPARKIDLVGLDNLDDALGGIDFPGTGLNWIRLYIVEDFPNTYVVTPDDMTAELRVPSNVL